MFRILNSSPVKEKSKFPPSHISPTKNYLDYNEKFVDTRIKKKNILSSTKSRNENIYAHPNYPLK